MQRLGRVGLMFADAGGFSGQKAASLFVNGDLHLCGHKTVLFRLPALQQRSPKTLIKYIGRLIGALKDIWFEARDVTVLHVNLGQSSFSMIRDGLAVFLALVCFPGCRLILSLHGNNLSSWGILDVRRLGLSSILQLADGITVLGYRQASTLISWGKPGRRIIKVNNRCDLPPISITSLREKHRARTCTILFLGSLIPDKGYVRFLEAIKVLDEKRISGIRGILCGKFLDSISSAEEFESTEYIDRICQSVNANTRNSIEWIKGASGTPKLQILRESNIVVFPSLYKTEAQPIVLIEAMSQGCAILSSRIGVISEMFSKGDVVWLETASAAEVATKLEMLVKDNAQCERLGASALRRFEKAFSGDLHRATWNRLVQPLNGGREFSIL